jgi:hypothetical protein
MGNLPTLDFCFYCRGWIPDWTFPHVCGVCLAVIRSGGKPGVKTSQDLLIEEEDAVF